MPYTLQLRTNGGCTAHLVLAGDQRMLTVSDRNRVVSRDNRYGFRPLSCLTCRVLGRPCPEHDSARPFIPWELAPAARAAAARPVARRVWL